MRARPISNFEGLYSITQDGKVYSHIRKKYLKGWIMPKGYRSVRLYKNEKPHSLMVHRLVATAWIDNPHKKQQVNHIDGDKTNNVVSNLEWCTASENIRHADKTGLRKMYLRYRKELA